MTENSQAWRLATIDVLVTDRDSVRFERVWAITDGVLAVHKAIGTTCDLWTVTHAKTGMWCANHLTRGQISKAIQHIETLIHTRLNDHLAFLDLGVCDALLFAPTVHKKIGYDTAWIAEWKRDIGVIAEKAHACRNDSHGVTAVTSED